VLGVPQPTQLADVVTWGVASGTRIGYVYVTAWRGEAGDRFEHAIRELTQELQTDGLIIDFRFNRGGDMFLSDAALGMLFDRPVPTIGFAERADPDDHPIAVLTGPGAVSSGDQVALRMTYHPRARIFDKSTSTAFNSPCPPGRLDHFDDTTIGFAYACADGYHIDSPHDYLTHDEFPVDEPVWLMPDDVAQGRDSVVGAALRWIVSQTQ